MYVCYSLLSSLSVLYCPVVDLGWWQSGWNTLKALSHLSTRTLMSRQQTDRQTERVRAHTQVLHTHLWVMRHWCKMQSLPTVCQEKKKDETVWHEMTAGSTVLTQEEAVDIYWAAVSIWLGFSEQNQIIMYILNIIGHNYMPDRHNEGHITDHSIICN